MFFVEARISTFMPGQEICEHHSSSFGWCWMCSRDWLSCQSGRYVLSKLYRLICSTWSACGVDWGMEEVRFGACGVEYKFAFVGLGAELLDRLGCCNYSCSCITQAFDWVTKLVSDFQSQGFVGCFQLHCHCSAWCRLSWV